MTTLSGAPAWSGIGAEHWDGKAAPDDLRLTSASSIVKVMASPALERWTIDTTAEVTVDNLGLVANIAGTQGRDAAVDWVRQARWKPREGAALGAAATGTLVHDVIERWGKGLPIEAATMQIVDSDPVIRAMLDRAWEWFQRYRPEFLCAERTVFDPANGIAGRFDAHWRIPDFGDRVLVDIKTTRDALTGAGNKKRPYPDQHALQLATYRWAPLVATFEGRTTGKAPGGDGPRFYLLNAAEIEACEANPTIDATAILHITPAACGLWPVDTSKAVHDYALAAAALHRWLYADSKKAIRGFWGEEATA